MTTRIEPKALRRVLCIRLDNMGDVLMTTPAIRALKDSFPRLDITLLASRLGAEIVPFIPTIDDVITYDAPWVRTYGETPNPKSIADMAARLATREFDAAFIFTVYTQSPLPAALLTYLARIPIRVAHCHENPYHLLTHWLPDPEPTRFIRHEVERQLQLVQALGASTLDRRLTLRLPVRQIASARRLLSRVCGRSAADEWVIIHPGGSEERRLYGFENFLEVARLLRAERKVGIIITGSPAEAPMTEALAAAIGPGAVSLGGKTSIGELAALISLAPLLISNNTSAVHLAAAVGTPVVDVYARTNPQHTPWMVPSRVLYFDVPCRDCERALCSKTEHPPLQTVAPVEVVRAAQSLLDSRKVAGPLHRSRPRPTTSADSFVRAPGEF